MNLGRRVLLWLFGGAAIARPATATGVAPSPLPYVLIHRECGQPAFLLRRKPNAGDLFASADAAHLDGTPMESCSPVVCESCGAPCFARTADVRERTVAT